tara:strand:- start:269 stop:559 length:291 start_codon:yes stop_codon:yes gene_type:complete
MSNITKQGWALVHQNSGEAVTQNEEFTSHKDGAQWLVTGGEIPHKPSSTGRVWVKRGSNSSNLLKNTEQWTKSFFPTVFNLQWRELKQDAQLKDLI